MQQNLIRVLASLRRTLCPEYDNSMTLCFASETRVLLELHHSNLDRPNAGGTTVENGLKLQALGYMQVGSFMSKLPNH